MITLLLKIPLILLGLLLSPFIILTRKDDHNFLPFFDKVWGNKEDGVNGDKLGWYSNYLKRSVNTWDIFVWSFLRNPTFNLRYVKWFSCDATTVTDIKFEGNSYNKKYEWSFDKKRKKIWFNFSCISEDKKRKLKFIMLPLTDKYSLKFIFGWKFYPRNYLDEYWLERIEKEGFPQYKDRAIFTAGISLKKT